MLVKDVMKREVATVGPDASLGSAARGCVITTSAACR